MYIDFSLYLVVIAILSVFANLFLSILACTFDSNKTIYRLSSIVNISSKMFVIIAFMYIPIMLVVSCYIANKNSSVEYIAIEFKNRVDAIDNIMTELSCNLSYIEGASYSKLLCDSYNDYVMDAQVIKNSVIMFEEPIYLVDNMSELYSIDGAYVDLATTKTGVSVEFKPHISSPFMLWTSKFFDKSITRTYTFIE